MALIDQARKLKKDEAGETPEHEAMPGDAAEDAAEGEAPDEAAAGGGASIDPAKLDEMKRALEKNAPKNIVGASKRIVLAGKKVMYSPETKDMVMAEIARPRPIDKKIAQAAMGLIAMLEKESKGTMPPDAAVIAGAWLVLEMADFCVKIGQTVTSQDVRDALDQFVTMNMMRHGADEKQIMGALGGQPATPGAPPAGQPAQPMQPQGGMPA